TQRPAHHRVQPRLRRGHRRTRRSRQPPPRRRRIRRQPRPARTARPRVLAAREGPRRLDAPDRLPTRRRRPESGRDARVVPTTRGVSPGRTEMSYINRTDAGRRLAAAVARRLGGQDTVVLGLPRGGVSVAFEIATALAAPLDVIVVRKIGVPFQPELAMGAIGEDGARVVDTRVMSMSGADEQDFAAVEEREREELRRRVHRFRGERPRIPLHGRIAVVVDDGIATGSTALAACRVARRLGAGRVVVAAPVGASDAVARLEEEADEVICPLVPEDFSAIGQWYTDFT